MYTQKVPDWHVDLLFKKLLVNEDWQNTHMLGACYVVPPIGSFIEHESGCSKDRDVARIPGLWNHAWCQEGTRKRGPHQRHRKLAMFPAQHEPVGYLTDEIVLPDPEFYKWLTQRPPPGEGISLPQIPLSGVWKVPQEEMKEEEESEAEAEAPPPLCM